MSAHVDPLAWKAAGGAVVAGLLGASGWFAAAAEAGDSVGVVLPATALTATAGAFLWLVRLMASGQLVHRDTADCNAQLALALERSNSLHERALDREEQMAQLIQHLRSTR